MLPVSERSSQKHERSLDWNLGNLGSIQTHHLPIKYIPDILTLLKTRDKNTNSCKLRTNLDCFKD